MYQLARKARHTVNSNNLPIIMPPLHHTQVKHWYHTALLPALQTQFENPNKIPEVKIKYSIWQNCLTTGITWAVD